MNIEPKDIIVLGAIRAGIKKFEKIQKIRHIEPEELNSILEQLENRGCVRVEEKKGVLGIKEQIHEAQTRWNQMSALYKTRDKENLKQFMDENKSLFPMMIFFGVMDMAMFSMMFSMMGMKISDYVPSKSMPEGWESMYGEEFDMDVES